MDKIIIQQCYCETDTFIKPQKTGHNSHSTFWTCKHTNGKPQGLKLKELRWPRVKYQTKRAECGKSTHLDLCGYNEANGLPLEYVADQKFLGIHITETLNWNIHLQTVAHKLSKASFMIRSLKENLSPYMIRDTFISQNFKWFYALGYSFGGE